MLMCTRGRGQQQSLGLPGRHRTRTPFSVGSQRHELGRLDIQETNKAPSQTGTSNQQQPNTQGCRERAQKQEKEKKILNCLSEEDKELCLPPCGFSYFWKFNTCCNWDRQYQVQSSLYFIYPQESSNSKRNSRIK